MSFWCFEFSKKSTKKIWQISALAPKELKRSGQIKKIKALSYINYGLFNVVKWPYFFDLGARADFSLVKKNILKLSDLYLSQNATKGLNNKFSRVLKPLNKI